MQLFGPEIVIDPVMPETPIVGRLAFKDKRLYIAAEIVSGIPVWIPLTNEINGYIHNQTSAASIWNITHSLNSGAPMVQIYDSNHEALIPDVIIPIDQNNVRVSFETAITGTAVIMVGETDAGNDRSEIQFAYTQDFDTETTVVLTHNLGYYPIVRVFIGSQEVHPATVVHDSVVQTTITFSEAQTGTARLI